MIKQIIGGVVTLVIGGTTFAVSQSDVTKNFSNNTGMNQQQAQQYINNISKNDLESFSKVGQDMKSDGDSVLSTAADLDCVNYAYQWETASLSCTDGKNQLQTIGNDEIKLGNCYQTLDSNLGSGAKSKMDECIAAIDTVDADYNLPITSTLDNSTLTDVKNTNAYNKSVLQAALKS